MIETRLNALRIERIRKRGRIESLCSGVGPSQCLSGSSIKNSHNSKILSYLVERRPVIRKLFEDSLEIVDE